MKRTESGRRYWPALVLLAVIATLTGPARALPGDRDRPMTIQADQGDFRSGSGEAHFEGNVYLKQGTLEVWADTLDVVRDRETGSIEFLEAHGEPARYRDLPEADDEPIEVRGRRIEYRPEDDLIITEGDGRLEQADSEIQADYIRYNLSDETLDVRSGRADGEPDAPQATWIIQPEAVD